MTGGPLPGARRPGASGAAAAEVEVRPGARDIAVVRLPAGTIVGACWSGESRLITPPPGDPVVATIPGDGFRQEGSVVCTYGWHASVLQGRHRRDRAVWAEAVRRAGLEGLVYVEHDRQDYYGRPVWAAVRLRPPGEPVACRPHQVREALYELVTGDWDGSGTPDRVAVWPVTRITGRYVWVHGGRHWDRDTTYRLDRADLERDGSAWHRGERVRLHVRPAVDWPLLIVQVRPAGPEELAPARPGIGPAGPVLQGAAARTSPPDSGAARHITEG